MSSPSSSSALSSGAEDFSKLTKRSPDRAIAFLVHSPDSVKNNLPPDCDNKPLARQRRRRTSPDDQKQLEEAFACNPRPSKEERAALLENVALGDKEVQIWFQNRRQSSRRKTKPLDTIDMNASLSGSSSAPSSPIERPFDVENGSERELASSVVDGTSSEVGEIVVEDKNVAENEPAVMREVEAMLAKDQKTVQAAKEQLEREEATLDSTTTTNSASSQEALASTLLTELGSSQSFSSSQDVLFTSITKPTYLANRRSASYVRVHASDGPVASEAITDATRATRLRTSGSYLSLSMSEDGQARVIDRSAPSPPRTQPTETSPVHTPASASLRRSYSAAGLNDLFRESSQGSNPTKAPRLSQAGRSRDSRAWEFWCDSEARTSLATKAEQENSGSAADAIGLIRQSSRKALRPSSSKANSPMVTQSSFTAINTGTKPARQSLQRANTTYGRLQESSHGSKPRKQTSEDMSPGPDSDKENWDPDENAAAPQRRRPLGAKLQRRRTILGENANIPSYSTSLGGLMESEKKRRRSPEKLDVEVAAFMGGDVDESEAVRGLLGLAKGNWR